MRESSCTTDCYMTNSFYFWSCSYYYLNWFLLASILHSSQDHHFISFSMGSIIRYFLMFGNGQETLFWTNLFYLYHQNLIMKQSINVPLKHSNSNLPLTSATWISLSIFLLQLRLKLCFVSFKHLYSKSHS